MKGFFRDSIGFDGIFRNFSGILLGFKILWDSSGILVGVLGIVEILWDSLGIPLDLMGCLGTREEIS